MQGGVVIFGVVDNHHHAPPGGLFGSAALPQFGQKVPGRHAIKASAFASEKELAVTRRTAKSTNAFARGRVERIGVGHFGGTTNARASRVVESELRRRPINQRLDRWPGVEFFMRGLFCGSA